jgi:hypothetical protein
MCPQVLESCLEKPMHRMQMLQAHFDLYHQTQHIVNLQPENQPAIHNKTTVTGESTATRFSHYT